MSAEQSPKIVIVDESPIRAAILEDRFEAYYRQARDRLSAIDEEFPVQRRRQRSARGAGESVK